MKKKVCLTGIKPTGMPHLGHYLGVIRPAIEMANSSQYDAYYFIADYHALTTVHDPKLYKQYIYEVTATWLALGLDTKKSVLYKQSDIPEVAEMNWILACFANKGLMNRAHAYKAIVQDNEENQRDPDQGVNMGLFTYPILMSADILFAESEIVPVGADNLQHLEIARDIAAAFNHIYGDIFKLPEALVREETGIVPGLDGRKMSNSYHNFIPLFDTEKRLKKLINKITTDSTPPEEPKNPDDSLIFDLFCHFANDDQIKDFRDWYGRGIGWGEAKAELFKVVNAELQAPREKYFEFMENPAMIDDILKEGAERMRPKALDFLTRVKKAIGAL